MKTNFNKSDIMLVKNEQDEINMNIDGYFLNKLRD